METLIRSVRLSEMDDIPAVPYGVYVGRFTDSEISAMRSRLRNRLRFDNRTGKTFDGRECIEAFRQHIAGTPEQMA